MASASNNLSNGLLAGAYSRGRTRVDGFHVQQGVVSRARTSSCRCIALAQVSDGITPPMFFPEHIVHLYSRGQLKTGSSGGGT